MADLTVHPQVLKKTDGSVRALRGVDQVSKHGKDLGFPGPNGTIKTTTTHCLLDLFRPNSGTCHIPGQ